MIPTTPLRLATGWPWQPSCWLPAPPPAHHVAECQLGAIDDRRLHSATWHTDRRHRRHADPGRGSDGRSRRRPDAYSAAMAKVRANPAKYDQYKMIDLLKPLAFDDMIQANLNGMRPWRDKRLARRQGSHHDACSRGRRRPT